MTMNLVDQFYQLTVEQIMDRRVWDLPIIEESGDLHSILNILGARNHIWVVDDKKEKTLVGVITEHDVLSILAPKKFPSYVLGMPDVRSIRQGTARDAGDIKCSRMITCSKDDKILDILEKMTKFRMRRVPVVDEEKHLLGEITLHQLIRKYYDATQYIPIADYTTEDEKVD